MSEKFCWECEKEKKKRLTDQFLVKTVSVLLWRRRMQKCVEENFSSGDDVCERLKWFINVELIFRV